VGGGDARVIRLAVRVAREHADLVTAELMALSPAGMEERDVDEGTVELAIYGAPGEVPDLGAVRAAAGDALVDVSTSEVPDGWEDRWRDWHRPLDIGALRVRPPWEPARPGALDVVIDPGQAFGTGAHASTRLTLELLQTVPPTGPLADWGCGSGILAVAAARLGFDPILACDLDRESVDATIAAAAANGIEAVEVAAGASIPIGPGGLAGAGGPAGAEGPAAAATGILAARHDLRRAPGPWAPTVTANLVRPLLLEIAAAMERPPVRLIASGVLPEEVGEVAGAFGRHGLQVAARRESDGWSAILLSR